MVATDAVNLNSPVRGFWRTVGVVGLAAFIIGLTFPNIFIVPGKFVIGITLGTDWTITAVDSSTSAWLHVGDRIDPSSLSPDDRLAILGPVLFGRLLLPGETLHLLVERAGKREAISIQSPPHPSSLALFTVWVKRLTASIFIVAAAMLVLIRPCRMTWGFFLFALGSANATPFILQFLLPALHKAGWWIFNTLIYGGLSTAGLWIFSSRFPSDFTSGWRSYIDRAAPLAGVVASAVNGLFSFAALQGWHSLNSWNVGSSALNTVFFAVGMLSLGGGYFGMTASQRQRLKWVVGGFGIYLIAAAYYSVAAFLPAGGWPASWTSAGYPPDILNALVLCIPATVVYAVLKHHVLDISFVISRALVFGTLTTVLVGAFALVDWFFTKAMQQQRLAVYAEVGVALGFGFGLNGMHRRVDVLIDRVLFRRRHLAEARLERVAAGISHAVSNDAVDAALVKEPADAFQLASAAIFRKQDSGNFGRAAAVGWPSDAGEQLHPNDPIVLHMQGERGPMRLRDVNRRDDNFPKDAATPIIAFPLMVRHQLEGLALYGAHVTGEDIDPDEIRTLERLSTSAAAAYDHIEAQDLRSKVQELQDKLGASQVRIDALIASEHMRRGPGSTRAYE